MGKKKKRKDLSASADQGMGSLALALSQGGFRASKESAPQEVEEQKPPESPESPESLDTRQWKTQIEKKGHGGKTVTLVRGMKDPEVAAAYLKKKLGTAARVKDDFVVVQGDLRERIAALQ